MFFPVPTEPYHDHMTIEQHSRPDGGASREDFCVVGIGAAAGSLPALDDFFGALPETTGMAFVVVPHLEQGQHTLLPERLQRRTAMQVRPVSTEEEILPDTVYVAPSDGVLSVVDRRLQVTRTEGSRGEGTPIDALLQTLARDRSEYAVGILLSGEGSDGTLGISEVRELGGMTLAQDPA